MTTAIGDIAPAIKRAGTLLEEAWIDQLIQMRIERALNLVGRATLRFADAGFALSATDTFTLGTEVSIAEPSGGTLFDGTVTGVSLEQSARAIPELVVVIDDAAYKLARGTHVATYTNTTYAQVIQQIARRHGLTPQVGPNQIMLNYLLQAGSELEFLNSIVRRIGFAWWIDGAHTLKAERVESRASAKTLTLGDDLYEFQVRASALRPTDITVTGWDPDSQQNVPSKKPTPAAGTSPQLLSKYAHGTPLAAAPAAVADLPPLTAQEASAIADSLYTDVTSAAIVARGTATVSSSVAPGVTITVADAGPASGNYLVTEVEHVYDQSGFFTKFVSGPQRPAGLVDTLGAPPADPGFLSPGLVVAVVTDNDDPEHAGRVKVRYTAVDGEVESPWARVVTLGAGKARGAVFQPEVRDEVLVGFEHGDTRRPVVLGGLFSKANTLPTGQAYVAAGKVNYRRITSRKNHMIELADGEQPAQDHIMLLLGSPAHKLRLGADRFDLELTDGKPITIKSGSAMFDINAAGNISIEGKNVTIKADNNLLLQGGAKAVLEANGQTQVHGAKLDVKADGIGNVEAGGPLSVKGAIVQIN